MIVYTIDELRDKVSEVAIQYGVKKVALFGSYSTGSQTPGSDIDLIIDKGDIKGLFNAKRNIAANNYGEMDYDILWETAISDIPSLRDYCNDFIIN